MSAVVAVVVFVIAYVLIATEKLPRVTVALAGAGVALAFGVVGSGDAFYFHDTGVDWAVIFLLLGMMIVGICAAPVSSSTWRSGPPNAPRDPRCGS
ncbi:SLC13 family permease [Actinocatenispora sera]|uniref:SLC13 family permease n=1 Tax=Actinocatenispora sera TaxID=390989 RepID=UPI0033DE9759